MSAENTWLQYTLVWGPDDERFADAGWVLRVERGVAVSGEGDRDAPADANIGVETLEHISIGEAGEEDPQVPPFAAAEAHINARYGLEALPRRWAEADEGGYVAESG